MDLDLSPLGTGVAEIRFDLESTDVGEFGMNTPSFVAIDNLALGATPLWAGYDLLESGWVDTGSFLGWVYPVGDYVYILAIGKYVYLPEPVGGIGDGAWIYIPQ